jgi:hypothetical protein
MAAAIALAGGCGSHAPPAGYASTDSGAGGSPPGSTDAATSYVPPLESDASLICSHPDCDGDGYATPADCNDDNAQVNPEAYDFIGDGIDNDCDGKVDDPVVNCETTPASPPGTPTDFARAADLCAQRSKTNAGTVFDPVIKAAWGAVSGTSGTQVNTSTTKTEQVNIVSAFGQNGPQSGTTMFGLSNGPWGATDPRSSPALDPAGFHLDDACADIPLMGLDCDALTGNSPVGAVSVQDWGELTLWVQVPSNVSGVHFDFMFFSSEFNQWWNSSANDAFFALVSSKELSGANVARDTHGLAITVNSDFFQLCPASPGPAGLATVKSEALQQCVGVAGSTTQGIAGTLAGTGYDGAAVGSNDTVQAVDGSEYIYGGGSGWLTTSFGVTPGEQLQLRIVIMDTFDGLKDSVVLIDNFGWDATQTPVGVTRPPK